MILLSYLRHGADCVNLSDELAVGLEEEEKLEVQLVESLTKLQLLKRHERTETASDWSRTDDAATEISRAHTCTCKGTLTNPPSGLSVE